MHQECEDYQRGKSVYVDLDNQGNGTNKRYAKKQSK